MRAPQHLCIPALETAASSKRGLLEEQPTLQLKDASSDY